MDNPQTENLDDIPESNAARWAWRLSLIPFWGIPLYVVTAAYAVCRMGFKPMTGFHWLIRGAVLTALYLTLYSVIYFSGYSGYYPQVYDTFYFFMPKNGVARLIDDRAYVTFNGYTKLGVQVGTWTERYPDGKKREEGVYRSGKREGLWTKWHPNGNKWVEAMYKNDQLDGPWICWDEQGQKVRELDFRQGIPASPSRKTQNP